LVFPFFFKRSFNILKNSIFTSFLNINNFVQQRLRFSGLGYFVEKTDVSLKLHVGLTRIPVVSVPHYISLIRINKRKKKLLVRGFSLVLINNYCSALRSIRICDVYKGKGIR